MLAGVAVLRSSSRAEYVPGSELLVAYSDERNTLLAPAVRNRAFALKGEPPVPLLITATGTGGLGVTKEYLGRPDERLFLENQVKTRPHDQFS